MMSLMRNDPPDTLIPLGQAMNRLLEESFFGLGRFGMFRRALPLDIHETEHEFIVEASAPGIAPDALHISVSGDILTIFAEGTFDEDKADTRRAYLRRERYQGEIYRSVKLPITVDSERISATYEQGVLTVRLPKAERTLPREAPITLKKSAPASQ